MRRSANGSSLFILLLGAVVASCTHSHPAPANAPAPAPAPAAAPVATRAAQFPSGWRFEAGGHATQAPHAMIASNSRLASEAGVEILKRGGNAVDAAVATGFALEVTFPAAGNIGGGGFMVIHMAGGQSAAIDYREVAPLAATRTMYVDANGHVTNQSTVGPLAVGVPGSVAGMAEALKRYGTMSLHDVMQPAIKLASDGFTVDSALAQSLVAGKALIMGQGGAAPFYPNGEPLAYGAHLVQPALARTLRLIADKGPEVFYKGEIADTIAAQMERMHGLITKEDLARYVAEWRDPIVGTYRGDTILAMPPSSSGGVSTMESLNILETWPELPPFGSALYAHDVAEAFRRAFIDRNTLLGDPAFVHAPIDRLTSKAYARAMRDSILPDRATPSPTFTAARGEGMHTTHYSVVDAHGNAVATTTTLNSLYGSGVYVAGAGMFLNNEMDDFTSQPGTPNQFGLVQGEANAIAPGKRMLSAMSPTIVLDKNGTVLLVVGAAGGPTIITATTQIILNVIDGRMSLSDAMKAPRMHEQAWPDGLEYERGGLSEAVVDSLTAMGYTMRAVRGLANANAVMRVGDVWQGMSEPRSAGAAVGY
ncbi:MAG TPA: gamma-glutamyltransferase [Gemmatimonadaceae bacterium]|nr:gamma-glutamyltransferase [Gemmatimonadaceae bacterium]